MDIPLYIQHSQKDISEEAKLWIDSFLHELKVDATILEIGSGTGRDAEYIEQKGFKVIRTDIHKEFIDYQMKTHGKVVSIYDITVDDLPKELAQAYDAIFACAVFNHFSLENVSDLFIKISKRLNQNGVFAFNVTKDENTDILKGYLEKLGFIQKYSSAGENWIYLIYSKK
jgi:cyclopropane fatty-acyl-phospholipid synthase-like methyltransferase